MDKKKRRIWWGPNNIFTRTLLTFFLMSGVTLGVMFLIMNYMIVGNQKEKLKTLNISQLYRVQEDMDTRMEGIGNSMSQFLYASDTVSMMVKANMTDTALSSAIAKNLTGIVNENELVRRAIFYLPTVNTVFYSDGSDSVNFVSLEAYDERWLIDRFLEARENKRVADRDILCQCVMSNKKLYLISDFCVPNFLGAVFIELEMDEVQNIIQGTDGAENGKYFLYDVSDQDLIAGTAYEATIRTSLEEGDFYRIDTQTGDSEQSVYVTQSQWNSVLYGEYLEPGEGSVPLGSLVLAFLPFLICYTVFGVLYSAYVSKSIYQPIARLMRITVSRRAELDEILHDKSQDEMQYLEEAFRDTWGENRQNRELLANISQDMLEQMFRTIVNGRQVDAAYISTTLQGLGLEKLNNGRYVAIAGYMHTPEDREQTSMETGMYRRSLMNFVDEYRISEGRYVGFFQDQDRIAIAVCFPEDTSATQIKKSIQEMTEALGRYTDQLPFSMILGVGKTYNDIMSLRISYQEACEQLDYQKYVADGMDAEDIKETVTGADHDNRYFRERGELLAEMAEKDRRDAAEQLASQVIGEILSVESGKRRDCVEVVADILTEKMIAVHVMPEEIKALNLSIEKAAAAVEDNDQEQKLTKALFDIVKSIHVSSRKSRYRYVDGAKEYIASHYTDGNLTLNEVSDAVGISAPYLSGIFAESEEMGFASYLSNYRVDQAKQFLEQTTQSVTDIGYKCGFNSAQSFSRVFKKNTGFTPGQYRERCRENSNRGI